MDKGGGPPQAPEQNNQQQPQPPQQPWQPKQPVIAQVLTQPIQPATIAKIGHILNLNSQIHQRNIQKHIYLGQLIRWIPIIFLQVKEYKYFL